MNWLDNQKELWSRMQIFLVLCMTPFILYIVRKISKGFRCNKKTTGALIYHEAHRENIIYYDVEGREYLRNAGTTYSRSRHSSIPVRYNAALPEESFLVKLDLAGVYFSLFALALIATPLVLIRLALHKNIDYSRVLIVVESLGGLLLLFSSFGLLRMFFDTIAKLIRCRETVWGTVTSIESYTGTTTASTGRQRSETYFYPVVEYKVDGALYSIRADMATNVRIFRRDESIPVAYRFSYPEDSIIKSGKYVIPLLLSYLLGFFAAFLFGVFLLSILWNQVLVYFT